MAKLLVKGKNILERYGKNKDDYALLAELIYVNEEPKKIGFEIINPEKAKLLMLEGMCRLCTKKKANIIHESCSHLCYCPDCSKSKKDLKCVICGVQSPIIEINL